MLKYKLYLFVLIFSWGEANAEAFRNYFWTLNTLPSVDVVHSEVVDSKNVATVRVRGLSGFFGAQLMYGRCKDDGSDKYTEVQGNKTQWVLLPKEYEYGKLKFSLKDINYPWIPPTINVSAPSGYNAFINQPERRKWLLGDCWSEGFIHNAVETNWQDLVFSLEIDRRTAIPGHYDLSIPFYYGFEEFKTTTGMTDSSELPYKIPGILINTPPLFIPVSLDVKSACQFDVSSINLSHGIMTGRNADGNQTKPYNLNVTCTPGTSLSVKLLGTQKVSGKTENYTQCGTGGVCELTFDNGKYDETMTIDNSKMLSIKSTYRLNDITKPVAGAFEGSGVLQVLVN
ncbi:TPA: spore coat protein U domain-containing protein [Escherichia coli]